MLHELPPVFPKQSPRGIIGQIQEITMTSRWLILPAALCLAGIAASQGEVPKDGFPREAPRAKKDPLEGKAPPALQVRDWLNTDGKALSLADLRGKVVLIDFWGVW